MERAADIGDESLSPAPPIQPGVPQPPAAST
jgi:hypothetical protein